MAEPVSGSGVGVFVAAAGGLTVLGVSTGIDPVHLICALVGAVWAQTAAPQTRFWVRLVAVLGSALLAVMAAPLAVTLIKALPGVPVALDNAKLAAVLAIAIGYLAHKVIMPRLERVAEGMMARLPGMKGDGDVG